MASLITELQSLASRQDASVTDLLHKSLIAAVKLDIADFAAWVRKELDGYGDDDVPPYRHVGGLPVVNHPNGGYQRLAMPSIEVANVITKMHFNQPIGELEHSLQVATVENTDMLTLTYPPEMESIIRTHVGPGRVPSLQISSSKYKKILDAVRKVVLEWALALEKEGVVGEGMSFTDGEKTSAKQQTFNVKNFFGGSVANSQIQVDTVDSYQCMHEQPLDVDVLRELVALLTERIESREISPAVVESIRAEVDTLKANAQAPMPNQEIVRLALASIRTVMEGITVNVTTAGILELIGRVFAP